MRRERRQKQEDDNIKWGKLISFIVAIVLLGIAIAISMNNNKKIGEANYTNQRINSINTLKTEEASSELSKNINQVKEENEIKQNMTSGGDNEEEDNEVLDIKNVLATNANEISNSETIENVNTELNESTETQNNNEEKEEIPKTEFIYPVDGEVIKEFAKDNLIYSETLEEWITHTGIDIKVEKATVVKAVADGTIKSIKNDPRYGLTVTIEHSNGYTSVYSSLLTSEFVKEGESVKQGQSIGTVGNSAVFEAAEGSHLHFELLKDGSTINPEIYLK